MIFQTCVHPCALYDDDRKWANMSPPACKELEQCELACRALSVPLSSQVPKWSARLESLWYWFHQTPKTLKNSTKGGLNAEFVPVKLLALEPLYEIIQLNLKTHLAMFTGPMRDQAPSHSYHISVVSKELHRVRALVNSMKRRERVAMSVVQTSIGQTQK